MQEISKLFTRNFLFTTNRSGIDALDWVFFGIGIAFLLLYVYSHFVAKKLKKTNPPAYSLWVRIKGLAVTVGFLGVLWFGLRFQYVEWLGTRFAFLLVILLAIVWAGFIFRYLKKTYPSEKTAFLKAVQKQKYLK